MHANHKPLGIGIVGCGMIANVHAYAIRNLEGAVLAGACSKSDASAEKFCAQQQIPKFESFDAMLASDTIDAVSLCTPSGDHCGQILRALEAGKHVVVEKPMCITLEECDRVIAKAEETGLTVCVISQHRFSDGIAEIRRAIAAGELGKIHSIQLTMHYFRPQSYYDSAAWRGTWALDGGGVLMNQGIHGVDMLCCLLGKAQSVTGFVATSGRNIEVEDTACAAVRFESGVIGTIDASTCCEPGFPQKIVITCEKGRIVTRDDDIVEWTLPTPCRVPVGETGGDSAGKDPRIAFLQNHTLQLQDFVAAVQQRKPVDSGPREGKLPLQIILGIYRSSETGQTIVL